jgi:ATP-dependent DNA helicase RecQ
MARAPEVFLRGFDRPNLSLAFEVKNQPRSQILSYAAARRGQSGIVYCGTRAKTETLAKALRDDGHSACAYHGGMEADDRRHVEHRFATEDGLIVVATVAFGMGVDKPDIRWVAQADLPKSIESYYQEIGRAGRDGAPADTLTLYGPDDIRFRRTQIDEGLAPPERKSADHARLNALLGLAEAISCRRQKASRLFRRRGGALRQLRSLRQGAGNLRRLHRRAKGTERHSAHRRVVWRGPPDRHPDRDGDRKNPRTGP